MGEPCSCCGFEFGCTQQCPTCGRTLYWRCLLAHRKEEHGYRAGPEEDYRDRYNNLGKDA